MITPADIGGDSVYADGFAAAEQLRTEDPRAFDMLVNTVRKYQCIDEEIGWYLEASGPVIETRRGVVSGIRHNDLDRLPISHHVVTLFSTTIRSTKNLRVRMQRGTISLEGTAHGWSKLRPGDTIVLANQVSRLAYINYYLYEISHSSVP
ncbi:taurine catabolism dioxygenase [Fragilaria crotonensis]|nr:taurine catabolism dioxygenase [Fragilaria crotonensis]